MKDIIENKVTYEATYIQYYFKKGDFYESQAAGKITLKQLLKGIKKPSSEMKELIDFIRDEPNKEKRNELKSKLPGFIIQSFSDGKYRRNENIVSFTGYTVLDFDGEAVKSYAKELKQFLFYTYDCIAASYISPSGAVKCIMRIDVAESLEEYKDYYRAIEEYFKRFEGFDPTPKNAVLIMFYTYDEEILIRENPEAWQHKLKPGPKPTAAAVDNQFNFENEEVNIKRIYGWIAKKLHSIVDNGHPQLCTTAKLLGGYCAYYGLNITEAENWIHSEIERHPYLCKGIFGYKKTASEFINYGSSEPIELEHK